jgi:hypothetical protein
VIFCSEKKNDIVCVQAILHLVQSRFLGKDVFRERGQSSHSDYYQAHFYLPQDFILLLTNRHVSMLKVDRQMYNEIFGEIVWDFGGIAFFLGPSDLSHLIMKSVCLHFGSHLVILRSHKNRLGTR